MLTAILMVLVVVTVAGMVFMCVQAVRGELYATVWLCCGGLGHCAEFVGMCFAAILEGLTSN